MPREIATREWRPYRRRSQIEVLGLPLWHIAMGPDPAQGEIRGHARGIIAIGDIATGFVAIGGLARGVFACGGLSVGIVTCGGLGVGVLAFAGLAIGAVAVGGFAAGYYALGGAAVGAHVISGTARSPEAEEFFRRWLPRLLP